jgi:hypothetical protein
MAVSLLPLHRQSRELLRQQGDLVNVAGDLDAALDEDGGGMFAAAE